jgi:hypothetical protein
MYPARQAPSAIGQDERIQACAAIRATISISVAYISYRGGR